MATEVITRLEDVRPGDIYLGPIGGWVGAGISVGELLVDGGFRVGPLDVRHIGIVVEASRSLPPGTARNRSTGEYHEAPPAEAVALAREYSPGQYDFYPTGVIAAPRLAQAMPGGAEIVDMTYATHWSSRCAYARLPEDYSGQAEDAAAIARLMVSEGVGYSYGSYPALAAWHWGLSTPRLEKWIGRRQNYLWSGNSAVLPSGRKLEIGLPVEAICSVFADQAWSLTGKKIFEDGRPHQCVTPSQLGQRLLTRMDDVLWGWPSDHPYP
jgi:hypothetical protein